MDQDHPSPEQDVALARQALAQHDLAHAIHHIGGALVSNPANYDWLGVLHEIIGRAPDPLQLAPIEGGESDFVTAATRAYILAQQGSMQDALSLLAQVVATRPDVPYLQWASWWLQQPSVVQWLPYDFIAGDLVTPFLKFTSGCPCPMAHPIPASATLRASSLSASTMASTGHPCSR